MNKQQRKAKAIELMKQLDIYKPYIEGFEEHDHVCYFEHFTGFWVYQKQELNAKVKTIETEYKCTVYAITHEYTQFGECYSFLLVPRYKEDWHNLICSHKNEHRVFAYVWNKTDDWCSEFGSIIVKSVGGGLKRIG